VRCILYGRDCSDEGKAVPGRSRCRAHGGGAWARTSPASRGRYGRRWNELRAEVLREEPACRICGAKASDVDHIVAVADGGTDARSNLRALCHEHHKQVTAAQSRARRKRGREEAP